MKTGGRVIRNSLRQGAAFAAGSTLHLLVFVLLARHLGVDGLGRYSLLLALASVVQLLADMGVRNVLIRDLARDRGILAQRLGLAKALLLLLSTLLLAVLAPALLVAPLSSEIRQAALLAVIAVVVSFYALLYGAVLRAFEEMGADALGFVAHKVMLLAATALLAARGRLDLRSAFFALLAANVGHYLYCRTVVVSRHGTSPLRLDLGAALAMLRHAAPLGVAELLRRLSWQVDRIVLALLAGPVEVGLFSTAYKLQEAMHPLLVLLTVPLFPVFARQALHSPEELRSAHERSLKFLYALMMPVAVAALVLGRRGLLLGFGPAYGDAAPALRLLAPSILLLGPVTLYVFLFTALGRQRLYTVAAGLGLAVNLALDVVLVPRFGARGAAAATLAAEAALFAAGIALLHPAPGRIRAAVRPLVRPLVAGAAMAACCFLVREAPLPSLVAGSLASLTVYAGLLLLLGTFTRQELGAVAAAVRLRAAA